jgi:predicted nucleotidyltransferase
MHALIESNREAIEALCRRHGVRRLDVFGSAASGAFDPARSDIDLLVEFAPERAARAFDDYFGLKEDLEALLGRSVDLVTVGSLRNPFFREAVVSSREAVFG